ncbi:MAG: hypothetical protein JWQ01_4347 [Massilia sp.]|nr:hypothetical protein [Massilia sp.]
MKFTDDVLMAYADGELEPAERAAVEEAMRGDPAVAAAVAGHRALRQDVFAAFSPVVDEPVPERLLAAAGAARVVRLDNVRERRAKAAAARRWSWPEWGALAATLVVGVFAGSLGLNRLQGTGDLAIARGAGGALMASGRLDDALTHQLAGTGQGDARIGMSFVSNAGGYCRSFALGALAGLACREGGKWNIPVLARGVAQESAYRQAASELPPAVLEAIDARIEGTTLDSRAEGLARDRGWERAR